MSKAGKSATSLAVMRGIVGPEGRIAVADTENGAMSLYAGKFPTEKQPTGFDVDDLTHCSPDAYIKAINEAARAKYDGLIIDSASPEWGAILEIVDGQTDKFFGGWKAATPKHNEFIRAIVMAPMHIIVTIRQKDEYAIQSQDGRNTPVKIGMEPIQRKGFEYEFNAVWTLDLEHNIKVTHSAIDFLPNGTVIPPFKDMQEGVTLGGQIRAWLDQGEVDWEPPTFKKAFYVNNVEYISSGIDKETFILVMNKGAAYDRVMGRGKAKAWLKERFDKSAIADLTQQEGEAAVNELTALVTENADKQAKSA